MMKTENFSSILNKLHSALIELEALLIEEVSQLRKVQINPVSLQIISDNKKQLLSTISHYDEMRKQLEVTLKITAPYKNNPRIATSWEEIVKKIKISNELNNKVAGLLALHMEKSDRLNKLVKKSGSMMPTYGANGQTETVSSGKVYNLSV